MSGSPHPGYAFIPLPQEVDRRPRPHARLDRVDTSLHSGTLALIWSLEQPLHVGAGFKSLVRERGTAVIVRQHVRLGPVPCVPGATLKGVLRARYEAITNSCAVAPVRAGGSLKSPSSHYGSKARAQLQATATEVAAFQGSCRATGEQRLCPACTLFGLLDLRSRVVIGDALPDTTAVEVCSIPVQFAPRLHYIGAFEVNHRQREPLLEVTGLYGRKFAVGRDMRPPPEGQRGKKPPAPQRLEALPAGTRLRQNIRFLNLTQAELGGLLAVLGYDPASRLKVGAGKSHGFGRIRLEALEFEARSRFPDLDSTQCARAFRDDRGTHVAHLERLVSLHGKDC